MKQPVITVVLTAVLSAALFVAGCETKQAEAVAPPPTSVTVSQPAQEQVGDFVEFTGNLVAFDSVDLRARVKGFLKKINYVEGSAVKEGDLLFEIDPDIFQAQYESAKATLDAAKATLEKSEADLSIKQEMAAGNAASKLDVIQAQAAVDISKASVALSIAKLKEAEINLGYTKISSPVNGRIDKSRIDVGNLVGSDGNTLLANIVQLDPIYVYFDVDEATLQRVQDRMKKNGQDSSGAKPNASVMLALGASTEFQYKGSIDYVDNKVDSSTGTIRVRGVLANPDRTLVPGYFARVRIPDGEPYQAVLIPDRAIGVDQGQKYVLVVNDKNLVESRPIEIGAQHGKLRVVKKGLAANEWVITEGILRTRPGATVAPMKKPMSGGADNQAAPTTATTQPQA